MAEQYQNRTPNAKGPPGAGNSSEAMSKILLGSPPSPKPGPRPRSYDTAEMQRQRQRFPPSNAPPAIDPPHLQQVMPPRIAAWPPLGANPRLPPLNDGHASLTALGNLPHSSPSIEAQGQLGKPHDLRSLLSPSGPPPHGRVLEPLNSASPPGLHNRHAGLMEERMVVLEQRLMAAERSASEVAITKERLAAMEQRLMATEQSASEAGYVHASQSQQVGSLMSEISHLTAEVGSLKMRLEMRGNNDTTSQQTNLQLSQQVAALQADVHAQDGRLMVATQQLADALRSNTELRSQVLSMGEEIRQQATKHAAALAAIDRLNQNLQHGTGHIVADQRRAMDAAEQRLALERSEQRRAVEAAEMTFREEARQQQAHHLAQVAVLNREVEQLKTETLAASNAFAAAMERMTSRLQSDEAQLDRLRAEYAQQANAEALALGGTRAQVMEMQAFLANMNQQIMTEQALRQGDTKAQEIGIRGLEAQLLQAQDHIVKSTLAMMENKATTFDKAIQELEVVSADRNETVRLDNKHMLSALLLANTKKEKVGLERMMVLESSIRDIATATAGAMAQLQAKVDKGVSDVNLMVEAARETTEAREGALREQINASLSTIRAYARDMEEALERERLQLEEVVKLEIKGRMASVEGLKGELRSSTVALKEKLTGAMESIGVLEGGHKSLQGQVGSNSASVSALQKELSDLGSVLNDQVLGTMKQNMEAQMASMMSALKEGNARIAAEEVARQKADEALQSWFDQNQVDQKLNEELLGQEVDALVKCMDQHKSMLQDQMLDEVSTLRREHEQLHSKLQSEVVEREALGQIVEAHGDEFEEIQQKIDSCAQQARTLEIQLAESQGEIGDRIGELETHVEASDKFAAQERAAAKADLDKRLEESGLASASQLEQATKKLSESLAAEKQHFAQALEASKEEWAEARVLDRQARLDAAAADKQQLQDSISASQTEVLDVISAEKEEILAAVAASKQELFGAVANERMERVDAVGAVKRELLTGAQELSRTLEADLRSLEKVVEANKAELAGTQEENMRRMEERLEEARASTDILIHDLLEKQEEQLNEALGAQDVHIEEALEKQTQLLDEALAKQEQHQSAMETVMAQVSEEAEAANIALQDRIDEVQSMIEDEVHQMDNFVEAKVQQLLADVDAKQAKAHKHAAAALAAVSARMTEADAKIVEQLNSLDKQLVARLESNEQAASAAAVAHQEKFTAVDERMASLDSHLVEQVKQVLEQLDKATSASAASLVDQLQALQRSMDGRFLETDVHLDQLDRNVSQQLEEVHQALGSTASALQGHMSATHTAMQDELAATHKVMQEELAAASAGLQGEVEAEMAAMQGQIGALESSLQQIAADMHRAVDEVGTSKHNLSEQITSLQEDFGQHMANAKVEIEGQLMEVKGQLQGQLMEAKTELEGHLAEVNGQLEGQLTGAKTELEGQLAEVKGQLEEAKGEMEDQVESLAESIEEQLKASKTELHESFNQQLEATQTEVQATKQNLEERLEAEKSALVEQLQAVKAEADTALQGTSSAAALRWEEQRALEEQRAANSAEAQARLEARASEAEAGLAELKQALESQGQTLGQADKQLQDLIAAQAAESKEAMTELQQHLDSQYEETADFIADLSQKNEDVEAGLEAVRQNQAAKGEEHAGQLQTSLQDLRNALQQASTTSRTELDKALQELNMDERLSALQSALDGRINEAMSQIDSLQQDLSGENERAREVEEGLSMRLDELPQGMKEQMDQGLGGLRQDFEARLETLGLELGSSRTAVNDSKSQITQAENNMKAIMDEYKQQTQASIVGVSSRVEGLDGRASAAAARIEQIGAAMAEQGEQIKGVDEKVESLVEEFSETVEGLQESVSNLETRADGVDERLTGATEKLVASDHSLQEVQRHIALISGDSKAREALDAMQAQIEEAKASAQASVQELRGQLAVQVDNLQAQIDKAHETFTGFEELRAGYQGLRDGLSKIEQAQAEYQAQLTTVHDLEKQLLALQSEVESLGNTGLKSEEIELVRKEVLTDLDLKIKELKKELEVQLGQHMLSQKVEEANFRLTEDMNREWLRYTKDSETLRHKEEAELERRVAADLTRSLHVALDKGLERMVENLHEMIDGRLQGTRSESQIPLRNKRGSL